MSQISTEKIYEIIRNPLISEKSTFVSQFNYYVFKVSPNSNKLEINRLSKNSLMLRSLTLNTLNQEGKVKDLEIKW